MYSRVAVGLVIRISAVAEPDVRAGGNYVMPDGMRSR